MTTRTSRFTIGGLLLLVCACVAAPARAEDYAEHFAINIGAPVWDSNPTFTEAVASNIEEMGVRWIRMEFITDTGGDYIDYDDYDEIVDRAAAHGISVLGLVDYQSKRYSVQSDWEDSTWQDGFRDRVVEIVNHYKARPSGAIKFWEVWNEPDSLGGVSAADFGRIVAICYPAIKNADPQATAIMGGLTGYGYATSLYLRDVYQSSDFANYHAIYGIYPYDILGLHPYHWTADPSAYLDELNNYLRIRWRMDYFGDGYKRIWFTEWGWNSSTTAPSSINPGGTEAGNLALQAEYVQTSYALSQPLFYPNQPEYGPYVEKHFLFSYADFNIGTEEHFGVVDMFGARKPSFDAYKDIATNALENAALTATVSASGDVPPNEKAEFACDGTPFTKWAALNANDDHTLTLDLGRDYLVYEFRVVHAEMGHEPDYFNTRGFEIQSSPDGAEPWTTEFAVVNNDREPLNILELTTPAVMRHVRLWINDANDGADGFARQPEFEVWGIPLEPPPPPITPADLDGDGDGDLADFALLSRCFTGAGQTVPPDGCEALAPVQQTWEAADTVAMLSAAPAEDDLLDGMIGWVDTGGFHEATPGGTAGGLEDSDRRSGRD